MASFGMCRVRASDTDIRSRSNCSSHMPRPYCSKWVGRACYAKFAGSTNQARIDIALGQQPEPQQLRQIGRIGEISAVFKSIVFPDGSGMGQA